MADKFYLTTAIAYINAKPHMGHAMEFIYADIIARYHRLKGDDTYFLTGTDEHGTKIYKTAKDEGLDTPAFADRNVEYFYDLVKKLELTNDDFIRTTADLHKRGAQKLWKLLEASEDIYKHSYTGLYCIGCESFKLDKDLVDGKCPNHQAPPEELTEENYFFRLSRYSNQIKDLIESGELKVYPQSRKNEMLSLLEEGLTDVSFSRPKSILPWGVDVPGDENQVMYVWCDALSNYLTALGYADEDAKVAKYWPCDMHIIGKDILRFHAGVWIGMLLSAGIQIPKSVAVHGFLTSEGQKMSKSLGNVVDPMEAIDQYGLDALRFYLSREVPTGDDGDFSQERFKVVYESDLANNYGNLVSRVVAMNNKYFEGEVRGPSEFKFELEFEKCFGGYMEAIENFDLKKAVEQVLQFTTLLNQYVEETKPWQLAKEDKVDELTVVMGNLLEGIRRSSVLLTPYIPTTTSKVFEALGVEEVSFDSLKKSIVEFRTGQMEPLFPRFD